MSDLDGLVDDLKNGEGADFSFFDLTNFDIKGKKTDEDEWSKWAFSTLERAKKENIQITEKAAFELVPEETPVNDENYEEDMTNRTFEEFDEMCDEVSEYMPDFGVMDM